MIVVERRKRIKEVIVKEKSVKVSDLVKKFGVSEETIRRDLTHLEQEGILQKNYGGAILVTELKKSLDFVLPVQQRKHQFHLEKELIGRKAAELVREDQILILDAGSTTWHVPRYLNGVEDLMVITNALNIAEECAKNETTSIYLLGGKLRRNSISTVGPQAEVELKNYNADFVFLGTSGISLRQGFTSSDLYESEMKRAMVNAAQKIVVLADHSKLQKAGLTSFCDFEQVDIFITSDLADKNVLAEIEKWGVDVIVVSTKEEQLEGID
ncbi:DeoR/GlpR family DNA-binding transcription regulator [Sediminibacillus massiliensis]|uniref:DeoR/GlpR family DNA-binding transcription regulator n=1 Tax=Sediminibacillus massiliensis TaxID=1926277 RepID=UPI00098893C7|nr:DeoR/GlpR family DNA-binding transcription regulator [Sediminibacillus massiliensis]